MKWAVLVGGTGTNLRALLEHGVNVAVVVSHRPGVKAIEVAGEFGVPVHVLSSREHPDRNRYGELLRDILTRYDVEAIALAGFLRWLDTATVERFSNRILNVHPSLLPAFPGLNAIRQALDYGSRWTGVTVHIVDEGEDSGPIVVQEPVAIEPGESEASLTARIHTLEHRLYPYAVQAMDRGIVKVDGRKVQILETEGSMGHGTVGADKRKR